MVLGFVAAISLLLRHWQSIERYNQPASVTQPLLQQQVGLASKLYWPNTHFCPLEQAF